MRAAEAVCQNGFKVFREALEIGGGQSLRLFSLHQSSRSWKMGFCEFLKTFRGAFGWVRKARRFSQTDFVRK
jgi:hypothetical protein